MIWEAGEVLNFEGVRWHVGDLGVRQRDTEPAPAPEWNGDCPHCGAPAYVGLIATECSRGQECGQ